MLLTQHSKSVLALALARLQAAIDELLLDDINDFLVLARRFVTATHKMLVIVHNVSASFLRRVVPADYRNAR